MAVEFTDLIPATPPASGGMFDDLIPKQTGPWAAPIGGEFGDLSAQPWAQGEPVREGTVAPSARLAGDFGRAIAETPQAKVLGAAVEGWRATPSILTPEAEAGQVRLWGPIVGGAINTLYRGGTDVLAAGNALMYGGAETVNQITGDPRAGRDALMIAQVAPMAHIGAGVPLVEAPVEAPPAPRPQFVSERMAPDVSGLDPRNAIRTLIQHDIQENPPPAPDRGAPNQPPSDPRPQIAPEPVPPSPTVAPPVATPPDHPLMDSFNQGGPVAAQQPGAPLGPEALASAAEPANPQSAGAAASRDMTDPTVLSAKTPAQALTDFTTSVQQTVRDRARPGVKPDTIEDHNVYVPGVTRLESARVFDPDVAGDHDVMRDIDPAYRNASDAVEQRNHDILKEKYQGMEGDGNSVQAIKEQRAAVSPDALGVFQNEQPVSAQPVLDAIQAIKEGPNGKIEAVQRVMQRVEKALYDANGNLEVLPSQLYGARKNLTTIRDSKGVTQEASDAATARREVGQVQTVLDRVIGSGSTGYSDIYLPQWAHFSRLIDQQEYLQSKTLGPGKVTGPNGNLTANGMQKLLEQIAVDKKKTGNNPAKTLTEDQLNEMIAIRNELAAMQHRDNLAKSHGSPTVKKAAAAARLGISVGGMSPEAIDAAIHTVLAKTTLGAGNVVYQYGVKPILEKRREGKAQAIIEGTRNKLLRTDIPTE